MNNWRENDKRSAKANIHANQGRRKGIPLIRSFLLCLILLLAWYFFRPESVGTHPHSPPTSVSSHTIPVVTSSVAPRIIDYIVRPGDTFAGILSDHELSSSSAIGFHRELRKVGFSTLFPGDSVVMALDTVGRLKKLSLLSRLENWYHVSFNGLSITTQRSDVPTATHIRLARGVVATSLAEALYAMDVGDGLVAKFTDLFAWDINFFLDPRAGDGFEILFTERYAEGRFVGYGEILAGKYVNGDKAYYALGMRDSAGVLSYYDTEGRSVQKFFLKAPLRYSRISSGFSYSRRHPILGIYRPHLGIDYAAPSGTPVMAAADGVVSIAGTKGNYGRLVQIRHGGSYETMYGHLRGIKVRRGTRVRQGDVIGTVGRTGLATGPHLDYRMKKGRSFVNPRTVSIPSRQGVPPEEMYAFEALRQEYLGMLQQRFAKKPGAFTLGIGATQSISTPPAKRDTVTNVASTGS